MTDLQKSLFDTMKIFSEHTLNSSQSTKIIQGLIIKIIEENDKILYYEIDSYGSKMKAYPIQNCEYNLNDFVYVIVPTGDFSETKIILGKV